MPLSNLGQQQKPPVVLAIAGSDSCAGAGIQADLKTIAACACYGVTVITVITAQNTVKVSDTYTIGCVAAQLNALAADIHFDAIKIGLINNREHVQFISQWIQGFSRLPIVIDPVCQSSTDSVFVSPSLAHLLKEQLYTQATLLTPNVHEATWLCKLSSTMENNLRGVAQTLAEVIRTNVLVTGGDTADGHSVTDELYQWTAQKSQSFCGPKISTANTHGTGCTFSTAIACYLAQGFTLVDAISQAKAYMTQALKAGSAYNIGDGAGPVDHFFAMNTRASNVV